MIIKTDNQNYFDIAAAIKQMNRAKNALEEIIQKQAKKGS